MNNNVEMRNVQHKEEVYNKNEFRKKIKALIKNEFTSESTTSFEKEHFKTLPFHGFKCECGVDSSFIFVNLKVQNHTTCILKNYLLYLKFRNMESFMSPTYITYLKELIQYPQDIQSISFGETKMNGTGSVVKNYSLRLFIASPIQNTFMGKTLDLISQNEFINFIKKHIIYIKQDKELKQALDTVKIMNQSPFNF
ncbi:HgNV_014 [Dikerogammarus haemobaphes nudivirus]|nr:HgNV_014 [Dikerogammarus haemobaphes nudivirus]